MSNAITGPMLAAGAAVLFFFAGNAVTGQRFHCPESDFHEAAWRGNTATIELEVGRDRSLVNKRDRWRRSPLDYAAEAGRTKAISLLLKLGADIHAKSGAGLQAVHHAAFSQQEEAVKLLVSKGAKVDIFAASALGEAKKVAQLLKANPRLARAKLDGRTALMWAARNGHLAAAKQLLLYKSDVNEGDRNNETALHLAVRMGRVEMVRLLLASKADHARRGAFGDTPLHAAARGKNSKIVKLLVAHKADVNAPDIHGATALHRAANAGALDVMKILVDAGADLRAKTKDGHAPLEWTALDPDVVKFFLEKANKHTAAELNSVLFTAASEGDLKVAKLVLARGADVNARGFLGQTPLHLAIGNAFFPGESNKMQKMVEFLLKEGADPNLSTAWYSRDEPDTAVDLAETFEREKIVTLIRRHGGVSASERPELPRQTPRVEKKEDGE